MSVTDHDCGAGVEAYEVSRVEGGPFAGRKVFACPGCGREWLQGFEQDAGAVQAYAVCRPVVIAKLWRG